MCQVCGNPSADHALDERLPKSSIARRDFLGLLGAGIATAAFIPMLRAAPKGPPPKPRNDIPADKALERLIKGNQRYVKGTMKRHDFATEREALAGGQNPYAGILSCADSRIGPEFAFDTARGDVFVVRVAGNFVSDEGLASLEYTTAVLGTPLLVVLGHDKCGAVDAAIKVVNDGEKLPGHLPGLVAHIKPAVKIANTQNGDLLENAIRENVRLNVEKLKVSGPVISKFVEQGKVKIVGGIYRLATGHVDFLA
ncbi:MAG: carbonic anhydrase [Chthoniobacterales bacterium]